MLSPRPQTPPSRIPREGRLSLGATGRCAGARRVGSGRGVGPAYAKESNVVRQRAEASGEESAQEGGRAFQVLKGGPLRSHSVPTENSVGYLGMLLIGML